MRIFFTGAQGTGKTSVLNALPQTFNKIQNVTRDCIDKNNLEINKNANRKTQDLIFDAYEKALSKSDDFVCDRCLIDVLAFTQYQYLHGNVPDTAVKNHTHRAVEYIKTHPGLYIYFPIEFPPEDDGKRSTDKEYQQSIDELIYCSLFTLNIKPLIVHGTVEERVQQILEYIENNKTNF